MENEQNRLPKNVHGFNQPFTPLVGSSLNMIQPGVTLSGWTPYGQAQTYPPQPITNNNTDISNYWLIQTVYPQPSLDVTVKPKPARIETKKRERTEKIEKKHTLRMPLVHLIHQGLSSSSPTSTGLWWITDELFGIKWDMFEPYYQQLGSNAKRNSIKKRLFNHNFRRNTSHVLPERNCEVWEHVMGYKKGVDPETVESTASAVARPQVIKKNAKKLKMEDSISRSKAKFLGDPSAEMILKKFATTEMMGDTLSLENFLSKLKDIFPMKPDDLHNIKILLQMYTEPDGSEIKWLKLREFLVRFGPLSCCVEKVRAFVESGAAEWYHGPIDRENATSTLQRTYQQAYLLHQNSDFYLVRDCPQIVRGTLLPNAVYVFAVSFVKRDITDDVHVIQHSRLYLNAHRELCVPVLPDAADVPAAAAEQCYPNIGVYIQQELGLSEAVPVSHEHYRGLRVVEDVLPIVNDPLPIETPGGKSYVVKKRQRMPIHTQEEGGGVVEEETRQEGWGVQGGDEKNEDGRELFGLVYPSQEVEAEEGLNDFQENSLDDINWLNLFDLEG